jgi:hypothetical protein
MNLFFAPENVGMWDTWAYHHEGTFYLYYLTWNGKPGGVGLATSDDGVRWVERGQVLDKAPDAKWLGSGAVWPLVDSDEQRFLLSFAEWRDHEDGGTTTMFFAVSTDLVTWTRLGDEHEFRHSGRAHDPTGRWDNLWAVPRPGGGYLGYWIVSRRDEKAGLGFGQSDDGLSWEVLEPAELIGVPWGPAHQRSPEIAAAYRQGDRTYALLGLDDLELESFVSEDFTQFRPGLTTFVADRPEGPFVPSPRNRRVLVGNASYFARFIDTPDGVLVDHHSWETSATESSMNVDWETVCLAPLKRAAWDADGTLRLMWWEGNESAKTTPVALSPGLADTAFDTAKILVVEGVLRLRATPAGLFMPGDGDRGTLFLVRDSGLVEYGDSGTGGTDFVRAGSVDRDLDVGDEVRFRLIRHGRITEFYLDDYLMQCYSLPEPGTGRVDLIGPASRFRDLTAWYCEAGR